MRRADWQARLGAVIARHRATPFAWGQFDCCLFAADAVCAMTDVDHAADLRGHYRTELGAKRVLRRVGGLVAVASRAGERIPPLCAAEGDVGIVNNGMHDLLAVCMGDHWLCSMTGGLGPLELRSAHLAWRVA